MVVPADDAADSVESLFPNHSEEMEVAAEEVVVIANSPNSIDRGKEFSANDVVHIANSPDTKDFEELVVSADEVVGIASSPDSIDEEIRQMERAAEFKYQNLRFLRTSTMQLHSSNLSISLEISPFFS